MSETPRFGEMAEYGAGDYCYRHANRPSFTLCQRCGNTVCGECQRSLPVGCLCPGCAAEFAPDPAAKARRRLQYLSRKAADQSTPTLTYAIIASCVIVWLLQQLIPSLTSLLWYAPGYSTPAYFEPWRLITSIFTHSSSGVFHILFNMFALWMFGRELELLLGKIRYALLYLVSGLGGCAAVALWAVFDHSSFSTATVGASGALFGLIAATLVVYRRMQLNVTSLLVLLGINLVVGFVPGLAISWQAHLGGMVFGALTMTLLWAAQKNKRQRVLEPLAFIAVFALLATVFAGFYLAH